MKLSAKTVQTAQPADKEYMLPDGDRLYLRVQPRGSKSWLFLYYDIVGHRAKLTLGAYPAMSLAAARTAAEQQRLLLQQGSDPRQKKREARQEAQRHALATFEKVAREWHAHAKDVHEWSEDYSQKILRQLELHAFPRLGRHTIGSLNQLDVLQCLEAISLAANRQPNSLLYCLGNPNNFDLSLWWILKLTASSRKRPFPLSIAIIYEMLCADVSRKRAIRTNLSSTYQPLNYWFSIGSPRRLTAQ